jgi:DNA-binding transcriptional ArsR family regulator
MTTTHEPDLARVASAIGEPARAAMLSALMGGDPLTAGELARRAHVAPGTASAHLTRLIESGLLRRWASGRERHYALANRDVAAALEALARVAPPSGPHSPDERAFRFARTCYDHLAGRLGVLVTDTLVERGIIAGSAFELTSRGEQWLAEFGIDVSSLRRVAPNAGPAVPGTGASGGITLRARSARRS